jgi:hypothetical protein
MTERRHYPPAVLLHVPHCLEGYTLPSVPIASVPSLVSWRVHFCFPSELIAQPISRIASIGTVPMVTVERIQYPPHAYNPSTVEPADAVDRLCRICLGTHGGEADQLLSNGLPPLTAT